MDNIYDYAKIDKALEIAQSRFDCKNAHFGVLRQYSSLSFAQLDTPGVINAALSEIPFDLNRRVKQLNGLGEILLPDGDGFIATHLRISLIQKLSGEKIDQCRQHFFANKNVFTGTTTADRLNAIFQGGRVVLKVGGNDWNKEGLVMKAFEKSGSYNQDQSIFTAMTLAVSEYDGIFDAAVCLRPGFMFGGQKENSLTVKLAQSTLLTNGTTATTENILCLEVIGVYMPGVAPALNDLFLLPTASPAV